MSKAVSRKLHQPIPELVKAEAMPAERRTGKLRGGKSLYKKRYLARFKGIDRIREEAALQKGFK